MKMRLTIEDAHCTILNEITYTKVGIEKVYTILFKVIQASFYIALKLVLKTDNYHLTGKIKKKLVTCMEVF